MAGQARSFYFYSHRPLSVSADGNLSESLFRPVSALEQRLAAHQIAQAAIDEIAKRVGVNHMLVTRTWTRDQLSRGEISEVFSCGDTVASSVSASSF
jgi:hypothetical protein